MIEARTENATSTSTLTEAKPTPSITGILEDLENGLNNEDMSDKYGIPAEELATLRKHHPALKGKRTKKIKKVTFTFVDDSGVDATELPAQISGAAQIVAGATEELPKQYEED